MLARRCPKRIQQSKGTRHESSHPGILRSCTLASRCSDKRLVVGGKHGHSHLRETISTQWKYPERRSPSGAMTVVDKTFNGFARRELDGIFFGKFKHARHGVTVGTRPGRKAGQSSGQHFIDRLEMSAV